MDRASRPLRIVPSPRGRVARVRGVAVESLGGLEFAARHVHMVRLGPVDVLCTARARRPGGPAAFVVTDAVEVVYATWPPSAVLASAEIDALRAVCEALAARVETAGSPDPWPDGTPTADEILAMLPVPAAPRFVQGPRSARAFAITAEDGAGRLTWRLRERRPGEPGLLGWRILADEWGEPTSETRQALQTHVVAQIVAVASACGLGVPWGPVAATTSHLEVDLGAPVDAALVTLAANRDQPVALAVRVTVPSRCECACTFCAKREPPTPAPERRVLDRVRDLAGALRPAATCGAPVSLALVGDDALRFPALRHLLTTLATCDPEQVALVTPGTALADPEVVDALVESALPLTIAVTLHGPDAATHDRVAGLPGAWARLVAGVERCRLAGLAVQVGHVLTAGSVATLPDTLRRASELSPNVHLLAFAPEPAHRDADIVGPGFLAATLAHPDAIRAALEAHAAQLAETVEVLEGFALCLVPASLRDRVRNDPHSRPDPLPRPPAACARCSQYRVRCPGPEYGVVVTHGEGWMAPVES